jgi:3D (Asp-Asp-Asp) domain-containing protein
MMSISTPVFAAEYSDSGNNWAKYSIDYVTDEGYFVGTSSTTFSPDSVMTRGMFVSVLARVCNADLGKYRNEVFPDVNSNSYYAAAVAWAYENGIVRGMSDSVFAPDKAVTRQQICVILDNYYNYTGETPEIKTSTITKYTDNAEISNWAYDAVYEMQKYGILVGGSGQFNPNDKATRAAVATVIARVCGEFLEYYVAPVTETETKGTLIGTFKSTFYSPSAASNGGYTTTATGAPLTVGETLAVDPSVIPLGSWVYLEFTDARLQCLNGVYHATDTGGAIKGYKVDVLVSSNALAYNYGIGSVKIYTVNK